MTKTELVHEQMVAAMKNKDIERKNTLSLLLSALKGKAKDKCAPLTDEEETAVILREIKQTKETLDLTPSDRTDIINDCQKKLSVLNEFAPKMMDEAEIKETINKVLKELNIENPQPKDKGNIMRTLMPLVKGKADGALVNKIVGELFK